MNAIRLKLIVTENGIILSGSDLAPFINKKVEIIILPDDEKEENKSFKKYAGIFDSDTITDFTKRLSECRKIEQGEW